MDHLGHGQASGGTRIVVPSAHSGRRIGEHHEASSLSAFRRRSGVPVDGRPGIGAHPDGHTPGPRGPYPQRPTDCPPLGPRPLSCTSSGRLGRSIRRGGGLLTAGGASMSGHSDQPWWTGHRSLRCSALGLPRLDLAPEGRRARRNLTLRGRLILIGRAGCARRRTLLPRSALSCV